VTGPDEFVTQGLVVLDDPVVDNRDIAGTVLMQVGVLVGRRTMRATAGVADADRAREVCSESASRRSAILPECLHMSI